MQNLTLRCIKPAPTRSQSQAGGPSQLDQNRQLPHLPFLCPCLVLLFIGNYSPCNWHLWLYSVYTNTTKVSLLSVQRKQEGLIREKPPIGGFPISSLLLLGIGVILICPLSPGKFDYSIPSEGWYDRKEVWNRLLASRLAPEILGC